jgi:hypothetical protein
MDYHQDAEPRADAEEYEPLLVERVLRIGEQDGVIIRKDRFSLLESNPMLPKN